MKAFSEFRVKAGAADVMPDAGSIGGACCFSGCLCFIPHSCWLLLELELSLFQLHHFLQASTSAIPSYGAPSLALSAALLQPSNGVVGSQHLPSSSAVHHLCSQGAGRGRLHGPQHQMRTERRGTQLCGRKQSSNNDNAVLSSETKETVRLE